MTEIDTRETPLSGPIDGEGGIFLELGDDRFECRKVAVTWHMMRFAKAQRVTRTPYAHTHIPDDKLEDHINGTKDEQGNTLTTGCEACQKIANKRNDAGMDLLGIMHDMLMTLLKPYERDRFIEFMETAGLEPSELEDAIGEVIAEVGGAEKKAKQRPTSSTSSISQPPMTEKSPHTSNGQGTEDQAVGISTGRDKSYLTL